MRHSDPALQPVAERVARGDRLSRDDALALFNSPDLLTLGRLADSANRRKNGDRVCFAANQHLNPTNVCVLRNTCVFCSFARMPQEEGAYTRTLDDVFAEADAARDRSEEHTSELQSLAYLVCRLLLEKKKSNVY